MVVLKNLKEAVGILNAELAKQAVQRKLPGIIKQIGSVQEYTTVRSTSAARKARAAGSAPGAVRATKRRIGSSTDERAIMQHGTNVTTTVKVAARDG
jgi:hypothetical protein